MSFQADAWGAYSTTMGLPFLSWLTRDVGVAAIPPSCFYIEEDAPMAANYARFCFAKSDEVR